MITQFVKLERIVKQSLALLLFFLTLQPALAQNTDLSKASTWRTGETEEFRMGFVSGIATSLMDIIELGPNGTKIQQGYNQCLGGQNGRAIVKVVDAYIDRHPESNTRAPAVVVQMALHEMCDNYLPHAPSK